MLKADKGDLQTLANGLLPSGQDISRLTAEGRDEVRAAIDVILKIWDYNRTKLDLALVQLDKCAAEIERLTAERDEARELLKLKIAVARSTKA